MILARNPLQQLSGNKIICLYLIGLCLAACSPKIQTVKKQPEPEKAKEVIEEKKEDKRFTEATVSLLIPFKLNQVNLASATKADVDKASMAINFYQGVKLGIDSAAANGLNFKVKVYDTRDNNVVLERLIKQDSLKNSNLLIGPIYPDGIRHMREYSVKNDLLIVSPLAATHPNEFNNPNLISIVNNIDLHATKIGEFISSRYQPANTIIVLINPKKEDDEVFGKPLRNYFVTGKGNKFVFQEYASVFSLETKMQKGKKYVILVSSSEKAFVTATLNKLVKLKKAGLNTDLFGHPNWIKQGYPTEKLQSLNTYVTTSYRIDYKSPKVIAFIKRYREMYDFEPDEYAFKGFDTGYYFGTLLAIYGREFAKHIAKDKYQGLHNNFNFIEDKKEGYINTNLMLLKYSNFMLTPVR
jgi:ABC-type branched-subunit amino acid transport system substrate-binding protein